VRLQERVNIAIGRPSSPFDAILDVARVIGLLLLAALGGVSTARAQSSQQCDYVLGFGELHVRLPTTVGPCLENEHHNPVNGDAIQQTAGGLLVWRKADNWTAFTDGSSTWINGPFGVQQRRNDQRLWWEPNPDRLTVVPMPTVGDRCHSAGLSLVAGRTDAGAGNRVQPFQLTNTTEVACVIQGYPGAQLRDDRGNALPTRVEWGGGNFSGDPPPARLVVPPGGHVEFDLHWEVIPVGDETICPRASSLAVTPPDEYSPLSAPVQIQACGSGHLDVRAIHPSSAGEALAAGVVDSVRLALVALDRGDVGCGDAIRLVSRCVDDVATAAGPHQRRARIGRQIAAAVAATESKGASTHTLLHTARDWLRVVWSSGGHEMSNSRVLASD
jgi:hypothetical protein